MNIYRESIWYADDATALGKLSDLKHWWDKLISIGPSFGNTNKTWFIPKENNALTATSMFGESKVNITTEGRPVLGSPHWKTTNFVNEKAKVWCEEIVKLSEFADSQPHAVYASITHGFTSKWAYTSLEQLQT